MRYIYYLIVIFPLNVIYISIDALAFFCSVFSNFHRYRLRANVLFRAKSSTSMCTWAINTVIDHYNRLGRPIFACSMKLSEAFDMVSWAKLFPELLKRKISPLILRCLVHIYSNQMCNVIGIL